MKALLGSKIKQSQAFSETGKRIPVTEISAGPCWVTQITDTHVQLGFGTLTNLSRAEAGHLKKAGLDKKLRFLRSFREHDEQLKVGSEIKVGDVLAVGDKVTVTGVSKGKGFAGVVRRHGFHGGPRTHGQSDRERSPGSIGQTTTPGRVYRGKRMAGRMGNDQVTLRKLQVVAIDAGKNMLTLKGLVPGAANGLLLITKEPAR